MPAIQLKDLLSLIHLIAQSPSWLLSESGIYFRFNIELFPPASRNSKNFHGNPGEKKNCTPQPKCFNFDLIRLYWKKSNKARKIDFITELIGL